MKTSKIELKVKDIIINCLVVDKKDVTLNANFFSDLEADSLDSVQLMMEFENEFKINIPDDDAENIRTVGEAIAYIKDKLAP